MAQKQVLPGRKRKRDDVTNSRRDPLKARLSNANPKVPRAQLGQTILTLGTRPRHVTCKKCGMQYAKTSAEDENLHRKYCKSSSGLFPWTLGTSGDGCIASMDTQLQRGKARLDCQILAFRYSAASVAVQQKLEKIASRVDECLDAAPLTTAEKEASIYFLCLRVTRPEKSVKPVKEVVGCVVARPIRNAYRVVDKSSNDAAEDDLLRFGESDTAIFCSPIAVPAILGVDRVWTSEDSRGFKIASMLLDATAKYSIYGAPITLEARRNLVAFSQPTQAGARLFAHWTGTLSFLVFTDNHGEA